MNKGFTLVELAVAIAVIAILATITSLAYSGMQNRARGATAASAAKDAAEAVNIFEAQYHRLPATVSELDESDQDPRVQYAVSTTAQTYCITATVDTVTFYINNTTQTSATEGACPEHGG